MTFRNTQPEISESIDNAKLRCWPGCRAITVDDGTGIDVGVHVIVLRRCYDDVLVSPGWFVLPLSPVRPLLHYMNPHTGAVTRVFRQTRPTVEELCIEDKLLRPLSDEFDSDQIDGCADIDLGDSSSHLAIGIAA